MKTNLQRQQRIHKKRSNRQICWFFPSENIVIQKLSYMYILTVILTTLFIRRAHPMVDNLI